MTVIRDEPAPRSFSRCPMLVLAVCFAVGILTARCMPFDPRAAFAICLITAAAALIFRSRPVATVLIAAAFSPAGMLAGYSEKASVGAERIKSLYDSGLLTSGSPVEIEGVLSGAPEHSFDGEFLTLRSDRMRHKGTDRVVSGNVRIFVPEPEISDLKSQISNSGVTKPPVLKAVKYGSRIRVACRLEREDEYLNPGVVRRTEILDRLGIDATCAVKSPLLIEHIADESVFIPLAWVYDRRARLIDSFRRNLSPSAAGVMIASLLGDKYFLDKDTADLFREGGTFHILVISGLHITFIGGLLLLLVRRLSRNRWLQFAVTTGVLWAYTLAVGADVPVVRAAVMFTVLLFGYAIYRQGTLLNSLGLCALMLLAWRPNDLFNPSFQLTFVSVAAIVACGYPLITKLRSIGAWTPTASHPFPPNVPGWLRRFCETVYWNKDAWHIESKRRIWTARLFKSPHRGERGVGMLRSSLQYVFEATLVSLIVQLWMLPLVIIYFHRVSFAGVFLNVWVGFFIALESFAAVIAALTERISILIARPFYMFAEIFNWLMLAVPRLFADNGWASFRLPAYSGAGVTFYVAYFLAVLFFAFAVHRWRPFDLGSHRWLLQKRSLSLAGTAVGLLLLILIFHPFSRPLPNGRLHIDHLDVGQGESILVTFPNGETLLVDGGGQFDYRRKGDDAEQFEPDRMRIGEAVVSQVLWDLGYSKIDHILATHADADHIEGLTDVAKNFTIGSAIFGRTPPDDDDFSGLAAALRSRGVPIETVAGGDRFRFGDVTVEVLYPPATDDLNAPSDNESSVVLRVVYGSRSFLLTGDIEHGAERTLVNGGGTLRSDVVKVAHHGSRTSSIAEFIDATGAKYAVISAGRRSPFGHPHAEIVERWRSSGADVMTTGERGMISISTDGRDLRVETFIK